MSHPDDALWEASTAVPAAAATSFGPPPSSDTPEDDQEPLPQPGSDDEQPDEEPETETSEHERPDIQPAEFDERYREPFTGLAFLGYLEKTVAVWGHTFRITTPSQMEKIQLGQIHREYSGTLAQDIAYQTLWVATCLQAVDGTDLPRPVTNDPKDNAVRDRFKWVAENLRSPVIDRLFDECMAMEGQVREVLNAMGEA